MKVWVKKVLHYVMLSSKQSLTQNISLFFEIRFSMIAEFRKSKNYLTRGVQISSKLEEFKRCVNY